MGNWDFGYSLTALKALGANIALSSNPAKDAVSIVSASSIAYGPCIVADDTVVDSDGGDHYPCRYELNFVIRGGTTALLLYPLVRAYDNSPIVLPVPASENCGYEFVNGGGVQYSGATASGNGLVAVGLADGFSLLDLDGHSPIKGYKVAGIWAQACRNLRIAGAMTIEPHSSKLDNSGVFGLDLMGTHDSVIEGPIFHRTKINQQCGSCRNYGRPVLDQAGNAVALNALPWDLDHSQNGDSNVLEAPTLKSWPKGGIFAYLGTVGWNGGGNLHEVLNAICPTGKVQVAGPQDNWKITSSSIYALNLIDVTSVSVKSGTITGSTLSNDDNDNTVNITGGLNGTLIFDTCTLNNLGTGNNTRCFLLDGPGGTIRIKASSLITHGDRPVIQILSDGWTIILEGDVSDIQQLGSNPHPNCILAADAITGTITLTTTPTWTNTNPSKDFIKGAGLSVGGVEPP